MPSLQYDRHSLHCVLGSVSNSSNSSTLPTSLIIFLDFSRMGCRHYFVVDRLEDLVGEGGSRSSWPIHEHESSQLVSQQNVQSKHSEVNAHLVQHWLLVTWLVTCVTADNGCHRSIICCFIFNVEALAVISVRVWEAPGWWLVSRPTTGVPFHHV